MPTKKVASACAMTSRILTTTSLPPFLESSFAFRLSYFKALALSSIQFLKLDYGKKWMKTQAPQYVGLVSLRGANGIQSANQSSRAHYPTADRKHMYRTDSIHKTWYCALSSRMSGKDRKHFRSWGVFMTIFLCLLQSPLLFWLPWWLESIQILYKDTEGWDLTLEGLDCEIPFP